MQTSPSSTHSSRSHKCGPDTKALTWGMHDLDDTFQELLDAQQKRRLPPVHLWHPEHTGSIDIRIDRDGVWYHQGRRIERQALCTLFATILRRDDDTYYLVTPQERLEIQVEDVPFIGIDMEVRNPGSNASELIVSTNMGDHVVVDADHPLMLCDDIPYVDVRNGLLARLNRNTYYRLIDAGMKEAGEWVIYSAGARFTMGRVDE